MNYSFVMGVKNINELKKMGFTVQEINSNYGISFSDNKIEYFEKFIRNNLSNGYWNEYLGKDKVFIFKFNDGSIKKYILNSSNEDEILNLCRKFADFEFKSIDTMLRDNEFYAINYYG